MTTQDFMWKIGRVYMGRPTRFFTRGKAYGLDRVPRSGGVVYAINHLHWVDIPLIGALSPRNVSFVAKTEVMHKYPVIGDFIKAHGTIAVRRGSSDRDAVRAMRNAAHEGGTVGLFVEGTRMKTGRPGPALPGAAMVGMQENVPILPVAIYGTQLWKIGNFKPCSIAFGEAIHFEDLPKGGKGYKEATIEIERRINALFDWLAGVHANGRPNGLTPPL